MSSSSSLSSSWLSSQRPKDQDNLSLWIEIVSARDLIAADRSGKSDPYVKVLVQGETIHKTEYMKQTLNPTFTAAEKNIVVWNGKAKDVMTNGLLFHVKDWDRFGSNDDLGTVVVPPADFIFNMNNSDDNNNNNKKEYPITKPAKAHHVASAGYLTVRIQHANAADRQRYHPTARGMEFWTPTTAVEREAAADEAVEMVLETTTTTTTTDESPPILVTEQATKPPVPTSTTTTTTAEPTVLSSHSTLTEDPVLVHPPPSGSTTREHVQLTLTAAATAATSIVPSPGEEMELVVTIQSCRELLAADRNGLSSDPYVKVYMGSKELHKTLHIVKTLNPVFDADTKSSFILKCDAQALFDTGGLTLKVKDWDRGIGGNDPLGQATVPAGDLYTCMKSGQVLTKEYAIDPPLEHEGKPAGFVTLQAELVTADSKPRASTGLLGRMAAKITPKAATTSTSAVPIMGETMVVPSEDKEILIEILSARNLLAADKNGLSDPYVKIKLGGKDLHETSHIDKTLNPVFSKVHKNFYILSCTAKELFENHGLDFKVKDWDRIGSNDELGNVKVPAATLYSMVDTGDEKEFRISPPKGHGDAAGFLTIRCRPATFGDREDYKLSKSRFRRSPREALSSQTDAVDVSGMVDLDDKILLIEILSCRDLLVADKSGASDPFVKIKMGDKDLHETSIIKKTLNPVFTEQDKNSYVLDCTAMDLYSKRGLLFKIKDWDRGIGGNDDLGTVRVPAETLYNFGQETKEFPIDPPTGKTVSAGFLTLRCSEITSMERDERKKGGFLKRLRSNQGNKSRGEIDFSDLSLLVEIVSCQGLIKADLTTSDPYVKVTFGDKEVHKTKPIQNTIDPIYTVKHGSVFILNVVKQELATSDGIKFTVKDHDQVGRNDTLGTVMVPGKDLCEATGDRKTYKLVPPEKSKKTDAGVINIRCRPTTNYDRRFLTYVNGDLKGDFMGIDQNMDIVMKPRGASGKIIKEKLTTIESSGPDVGVKKFKVRPYSDPQRPSMTKWLSDDQIQEETLAPSHKWVDIGSGSLGKVYVEILGADDLPNLDSSVRGKDKTDPFAMLVYEDCCAKTDIVEDCLSPRWLPWTQRAFIFNMDHSSSDIFVGIFDYDGSLGNQHDLVGRVAVEISSLRPMTDYVFSYDLYDETLSSARTKHGSITIRMRVEYSSQRGLVLSNLRFPPEEYINVKTKKDFLLIRKVVQGNTDIIKYSLATINMYIEELTAYLYVQYYVTDAIISLLFWRGQIPFAFGIKLPVHSFIAFLAAISMAEYPSLFFSYFWFANAWLLWAIQTWRNNTPNVWSRTKSFGQILSMLVLDRAMVGPETIPENHKQEEADAFEEKMKQRIEKAEAAAEKRREEEMKMLAEHEKQMAELDTTAETDISTQAGGLGLDPFKRFLYPAQKALAMVCTGVRLVRNVYIWEEPYFAFFLTAASILVGVIFLFVPWAFLIRWTGRIVAWGVFGPHMKLVDICYYSKLKPSTEEEEKKQLSDYYESQRKLAQANALTALIQTEDATKLKAIKKMLYGSYIARVPVIKNERFRDTPLHKSFAKPCEANDKSPDAVPRSNTIRIGGQQLVGNMIPQLRSVQEAQAAKTAAMDEGKKQDKDQTDTTKDVESTETTPLLSTKKS